MQDQESVFGHHHEDWLTTIIVSSVRLKLCNVIEVITHYHKVGTSLNFRMGHSSTVNRHWIGRLSLEHHEPIDYVWRLNDSFVSCISLLYFYFYLYLYLYRQDTWRVKWKQVTESVVEWCVCHAWTDPGIDHSTRCGVKIVSKLTCCSKQWSFWRKIIFHDRGFVRRACTWMARTNRWRSMDVATDVYFIYFGKWSVFPILKDDHPWA